MSNALPQAVKDYLQSASARALLAGDAIWFRWNTRTLRIESSGSVLKSTPEQMSRPGSAVFLRIGRGPWKRYA